MRIKISSSIVLYQNEIVELNKAIECILATNVEIKLYLIDNSPTDILKSLNSDSRIEYTHFPENPGFGAGHNVAIQKAIEMNSEYHFVINPDIYFEGDVISEMVNYIREDSEIGMLMPEILNEDGTVQNLPKLIPTPFGMIWRKIQKPNKIYQKFINRYELRFVERTKIYNAPILSGCFTLLNLKAIKEIGMYDDSYFMYFEDWDLSRRMHQKYKTIYYPRVSVVHGYDSGANKNKHLFKIFIKSFVIYFNKWGWIYDSKRSKINNKAISQFNK